MATLDERVEKLEQEQADLLQVMEANHTAVLAALSNLAQGQANLNQKVDRLGRRMDSRFVALQKRYDDRFDRLEGLVALIAEKVGVLPEVSDADGS